MLSLPDVTLVCVYTVAHELHDMAIDECLRQAKFGDAKLYSDIPQGGNTLVPIFRSLGDYERFFHHEIPKQIKTSHVLAIQWDSWIINPDAWTDEFLSYDYVGAPWWYGDRNVGNSGFCLLSKRLMEFLSANEDEFPIGRPWDHVLCREYQLRLSQFKWAPTDLAWQFSIERTGKPETVPFGFHGVFHFPRVLSAEALDERLRLASKEPHITSKPEWRELGCHAAYRRTA